MRKDADDTLPVKKRTKVNLTNCDIGRIVCGREGDPIEERAFERSFTTEKVLSSFAKIGAAPLTRAGYEQDKVRHETTEGDPGAGALVALETQHAANLAALAKEGANAAVFAAALPRQELIERPTDEAAQFAALVETGVVSHTTVWHTMGAKAHTSDAIIAAEAVKILSERATVAAAQSEQQSSLRLLQEQAIAAETERDNKGDDYKELAAATLKMIVKCLFQLKGKTGFSKIKNKADLVTYLEEYGEGVLDALNEPLPSPAAMAAVAAAEETAAAAAAAAAAATDDATADGAARVDANVDSAEAVDMERS